jgi:hypothetical protein
MAVGFDDTPSGTAQARINADDANRLNTHGARYHVGGRRIALIARSLPQSMSGTSQGAAHLWRQSPGVGCRSHGARAGPCRRDQRAAALALLAMESQGMTLQEGRKIRNDTNARSTIPPELVMETVRPSWRSS